MRRFTKTFVENRWYRKISPGQFAQVPADGSQDSVPIDTQIRLWVERTGNVIIHPGQIGMHAVWHGDKQDAFQIKCLTFGLTVLYQEASNGGREPTQHADPFGFDPGANAAQSGTENPVTWGDYERPVDRTRPA